MGNKHLSLALVILAQIIWGNQTDEAHCKQIELIHHHSFVLFLSYYWFPVCAPDSRNKANFNRSGKEEKQ